MDARTGNSYGTSMELWCRIHSRPLRVLEPCAGVSGSHAVIRDMGYRVAMRHSMESDSKTMVVVNYIMMYDGAVKHVGNDARKFNATQEKPEFIKSL